MNLSYYWMWKLLIIFFTLDAMRFARYILFYFKTVDGGDPYDFILVLAGGNISNERGVRKLALEELKYDYLHPEA